MNKAILILSVILIGLSAKADYTVQTYQPLYPTNPIYNSATSPYLQNYEQQYPNNPYYTQCYGRHMNPYRYRPHYDYRTNFPYSTANPPIVDNTTGTNSVVKNIGQSMLFSLIRGY